MPRIRFLVAYEGTRYAGWQLQAFRTKERPPTIQGELEGAIESIIGWRVPVNGAGRTDAGVHAEGQVCHADIPEDKRHVDWLRALNVKLPPDIRVLEAQWVAPEFHARKSAVSKLYAYSLWMHRNRAFPRVRAFVWSTPVLNLDSMLAAAALLTGRQNFASFQNSGDGRTDTVRALSSIRCQDTVIAALSCPPDWPVVTFFFEGDGFLKQMVRNLMGLLVWVGQGKIAVPDIPDILAAKDRRALPSPSAPAQGLTLMRVFY